MEKQVTKRNIHYDDFQGFGWISKNRNRRYDTCIYTRILFTIFFNRQSVMKSNSMFLSSRSSRFTNEKREGKKTKVFRPLFALTDFQQVFFFIFLLPLLFDLQLFDELRTKTILTHGIEFSHLELLWRMHFAVEISRSLSIPSSIFN